MIIPYELGLQDFISLDEILLCCPILIRVLRSEITQHLQEEISSFLYMTISQILD